MATLKTIPKLGSSTTFFRHQAFSPPRQTLTRFAPEPPNPLPITEAAVPLPGRGNKNKPK